MLATERKRKATGHKVPHLCRWSRASVFRQALTCFFVTHFPVKSFKISGTWNKELWRFLSKGSSKRIIELSLIGIFLALL